MTMANKILIFSTAYVPFVGGAEVAIKEIAARTSASYQYDLITARLGRGLPATERIGNITVYRIGIGMPLVDKLLLPFLGAYRAWKLEEQNSYHCFWAVMATYAAGAAYICNIVRGLFGKRTTPIVLTLQEGDSDAHLRYRWFGMIHLSLKMALARSQFVTAISAFLLDRAERFGYDGPRRIVPNGVDLDLFSRNFTDAQKKELSERLGKKEGDIMLLTTSRLVKKNAVDDIIRALMFLPSHVQLLVIGKGDEGPKLQRLATSIGVRDRVKFLGFVPQSDIPLYCAVSDIFVRPSRSEGFGNSFIEAMAARLPVVTTPVGGIPDFIDDHGTGVFCAPDNPKSVAEAVELLLEDVTLRNRIVEQAFARVHQRYSWDHVAKEMEAVFSEVK